MKIIDAINAVDSNMPNAYPQSEKVKWLSTLDAMIKCEVIDTHEGAESCAFQGYDNETDVYDTKLLVSAPYDMLYLRWLEAQVHYNNGEIDKYNNAIDIFNTAYADFCNYYNRTHMPKGKSINYF